MNRNKIFASITTLLLFATTAVATDIVSNGGFEKATWETTDWFSNVGATISGSRMGRSSLFSKNGGFSYWISNAVQPAGTMHFQSRTNAASAATGYSFSAWILRKNYGGGGQLQGNLRVNWLTAADGANGSATLSLTGLADGVWSNASNVITSPAGTAKFYITAEPRQVPANGGKVIFFDDITLINCIPPVVTLLSPLNNTTGVLVTANIVLTFNVAVAKGSGYIYIRKYMDDSIVQTIDINDATPGVITMGATSVTINLPADLASATQYYVTVDSGAIKDTQAVPIDFPGISSKTTWRFVTTDAVPPTVTALSPTNGSLNIMPSRSLVLTFDESVAKGAGSILIRNYVDDTTILTIPVTSPEVTVSNNIVTINPTNDILETNVYVNIPAGTIRDLSANNHAGFLVKTDWNFQVFDGVAPTVTAITPLNGALGVATASTLQLVFTENVQKGTGNIYIKNSLDDSITHTIDVTSGSVVIANTVVTITPPGGLLVDKQYYVTIDATAIKDFAAVANFYSGISGKNSWMFLTTGATAPGILLLSPADEAAGVSSEANLVIAFDKNICLYPGDDASGTYRYFSIYQTAGPTLLQQIKSSDVVISNNAIYINPPSNLPEGAIYVNIDSGAISNLSQMAYGGILNNTTWNFTVADTTPPTIFILNPPNNSAGFNLTADIEITFDEAIQKGTGNIYIKKYSDDSMAQTIDVATAAVTIAGNKATINPPSDLIAGVRYYVTMDAGAIKDTATTQNNYGGISAKTVWSFVAADTTAPTATAFYPLDGASAVVPSTPLAISFSEDIQKGSGFIQIKRSNDNVLLLAIDVQSTNVLVASNVVLITHPLSIPDTNVYVNIASGVIQDLSANEYAGVTGTTDWDFSILDNFAPVVTAYTPTNTQICVSVGEFLRLTFDEIVQKGAGNIYIKNFATDAVTHTIDVTTANVAIALNRVTITPPGGLATNMKYYVTIDAGAIKDMANAVNNYGGISSKSVWSFETPDTLPPTVQSLSPTNGDRYAGMSSNLIMTFVEPILWAGGSDTITIKRFIDNTTLYTFTNNDPSVVISGNVISIDPSAELPRENLYVLIGPTLLVDRSGNLYDGIAANNTWQFTVGEAISTNRGVPYNTITRRTDASVRFNNLVAGDEIWIYSASGYKLATVPYVAATTYWTIPANLSSGVYIVKIRNSGAFVGSYKIVILR